MLNCFAAQHIIWLGLKGKIVWNGFPPCLAPRPRYVRCAAEVDRTWWRCRETSGTTCKMERSMHWRAHAPTSTCTDEYMHRRVGTHGKIPTCLLCLECKCTYAFTHAFSRHVWFPANHLRYDQAESRDPSRVSRCQRLRGHRFKARLVPGKRDSWAIRPVSEHPNHRWNRNPRHKPQKFSKLVFLIELSSFYI